MVKGNCEGGGCFGAAKIKRGNITKYRQFSTELDVFWGVFLYKISVK